LIQGGPPERFFRLNSSFHSSFLLNPFKYLAIVGHGNLHLPHQRRGSSSAYFLSLLLFSLSIASRRQAMVISTTASGSGMKDPSTARSGMDLPASPYGIRHSSVSIVAHTRLIPAHTRPCLTPTIHPSIQIRRLSALTTP
jgi:hypothetical protein